MSTQQLKQEARKAAREVAGKRRAEREAREKRIEDLAVVVMTALGERDAAVSECEQRAGAAVAELVDREGLSLGEVGEWCDETVSQRDLSRLRRLAAVADETPAAKDDRPAAAKAAAESGGAGASTSAQ